MILKRLHAGRLVPDGLSASSDGATCIDETPRLGFLGLIFAGKRGRDGSQKGRKVRDRSLRRQKAAEEARSGGPPPVDRALLLIYVLALFSGVAALIYEVAWAKMLALTFGNTTLSKAAVIVGFMGGMGMGAVLYHRLRGHASDPLRLYALLEYGIAFSTALLSMSFYSLPEHFVELTGAISSHSMYIAIRFVCVLLLIAFPSLLMGATFPALCRAAIHSADNVDQRLGWIYGINTVGAALGALFAGLVLADRIGLLGSTWVANGMNIAVGTAALLFLRKRRSAPAVVLVSEPIPTSLARSVTTVVLFGSGLATLAYEILWFRGLRYVVGTSNYAFAVVLFTFLLGLGLGSLLLERAVRRGRPERDLVIVQSLIAVLAVGGIGLLALLLSAPFVEQNLSIFAFKIRFGSWFQRLMIDLGLGAMVLLPATLCMGLSFPLAARLYLGSVDTLDRQVGKAYLLANLGSAIGSIGAALVLLPLLGIVRGTAAVAGLNLGLALFVALRLEDRRPSTLRWLVASAALVLVLVLVLPRSLPLRGEQGAGRKGVEEVFRREGDVATIQVLRNANDKTQLAMAIDGYTIGWSGGFHGTPPFLKELILADLPMVLDKRIRTVLSIGLGSAATLEALADYPRIRRLESVEISKAVVEGSRLFEESSVLEDPRTRLAVDDAVHYLLRSPRRYDLIVSDGKQDPFFAGNADLLCLEFYRSVASRLNDHGMLVQWFPVSTLNSDLRTIIATMGEVFPHVDLFYFPPISLLFVGGNEPLGARPHMKTDTFVRIPVGDRMADYGFKSRGALLSRWIAGGDILQDVAGDAPISTWDRLILDTSAFKASLEEWKRTYAENLRMIVHASRTAAKEDDIPASLADEAKMTSARLLLRARLARVEGRDEDALSLAEQALEANPKNTRARDFLIKGLFPSVK